MTFQDLILPIAIFIIALVCTVIGKKYIFGKGKRLTLLIHDGTVRYIKNAKYDYETNKAQVVEGFRQKRFPEAFTINPEHIGHELQGKTWCDVDNKTKQSFISKTNALTKEDIEDLKLRLKYHTNANYTDSKVKARKISFMYILLWLFSGVGIYITVKVAIIVLTKGTFDLP